MTYSLVSATALGFDLVRLPAGERVSEVLLVALASGAAELAQLAEQHPGQARQLRWHQVRAAGGMQRASRSLHLAGPALDLALAGEALASTTMLRKLERAPIGDLEALDRLVRQDALGWTWARRGDVAIQDDACALAADVLVDAAASAYLADRLPDKLRRALAAPYVAARMQVPEHEPSGVEPLLEALSATTASGRDSWRRAADSCRSETLRWAPAMNEASWAAHLTGRTQLAATAQLEAVAAFRSAGFTVADGAHGVWNAISGVVQACVVKDLLTDEHYGLLTRPWRIVTGGVAGP